MTLKRQPINKLRPYQAEPFWKTQRRLFLLWRRQLGKSHTLASKALLRMMQKKDHLCVFVSASIALGSEFLLKEALVWSRVMGEFKKICDASGKLTVDGSGFDDKGSVLDVDALADLFEHQKLETRIWHSKTVCSRSRVVAPNPNTAVGWTGDIFMDEVGRIEDLRLVMEAVKPFMDSNPEFIWWMATTPPPDDQHYSFELFVPDRDEFAVNPIGNWYKSKSGIPVHRVDCFDADAGGFTLFDDDSGKPATPAEHRAKAFDKEAWDRNYALKFIRGGVAAVSFQSLLIAQKKGAGQCAAASITERLEAE